MKFGKNKPPHAKQFIIKAKLAQKTANRPIILHSDNGSESKTATFLDTLKKLGVHILSITELIRLTQL